ncbi:hypothetical protein ABZ897_00765 [Nonomuraea sp. NPDC046802]|uniref:hypothetical protein n=1 Tax=Nonomuraea sp. NPDC046802 TaxID=3154919 RepID=UPI0033D911FC
MSDPPAVRLPGHHAKAGSILQWRRSPRGQWWALVEYTVIVPGYRGGIEREQSLFRAREVEPIKGEDYSRVPRTKA